MKAIKPQYLLLWTSRRELWMGLTTAPLDAPTLTIKPLHVVSPAVPLPTLVDGRPQ